MRSRIHKRITKSKPNIKDKLSNIEINYVFLGKIACIISLYIILFFGISSFFERSIAVRQFEESIDEFASKNSETVFEIKEITLYTSATAKTNTQNIGMDVSTFTDISFNIDNPKEKVIKSLKIKNINLDVSPEIRKSCNKLQKSTRLWETI